MDKYMAMSQETKYLPQIVVDRLVERIIREYCEEMYMKPLIFCLDNEEEMLRRKQGEQLADRLFAKIMASPEKREIILRALSEM